MSTVYTKSKKSSLDLGIIPELLKLMNSGAIKPVIDCEIPLSEGVKGHQILEEGTMFGKVVLIPE